MNTDIQLFLEKVLAIISYKEDRSKFINEFLNMCKHKAMIEYAYLLPESRRKILLKLLKSKNLEDIMYEIEPYMLTEEYHDLFQKHFQYLFKDYLGTLMHVLTEEQKKKLYTLISSIKPEKVSSSSTRHA